MTLAPISDGVSVIEMQAAPVAVWDDKIYLFGGITPGGTITSTLIYDTLTDSWSSSATIPRVRVWGGAYMEQGLIHLLGGAGPGEYSIVDVYNPSTDTWLASTSFPGGNNAYPEVTQSGNLVFAVGDHFNSPSTSQEVWMGTVIPEPGTLALVGIGLLGVSRVVQRRRGKRRKTED